MSRVGMYKHLTDNDMVPFSIEETVKKVNSLNYGSQRFLCELVELRENSDDYKKYDEFRRHTQQLRDMLEAGWY